MNNFAIIEESFKKFYETVHARPSESLIYVDLPLLFQLGLLHFHNKEAQDSSMTRYFQVIETAEKITLINNEFVVWIVPEKIHETSQTNTLIAINHQTGPQLELTFVTTGVYNTSRLVLRILEKFLVDIQENEELLKKMHRLQ